ncbi:hypothetical protein CRM22_006356 [Opisthorchis felineus]|uniref:Glypican n=1 Tax=Opisthorchis felineus TaxID=147828 RepID=A0A4S2LLC9_OPIFE|nr:hypothetical protein CRM22_006356 [Opisthorchis felineus]
MTVTILNSIKAVVIFMGICAENFATGRNVGRIQSTELTEELCRMAEDEALSMGLKFQRSMDLPLTIEVQRASSFGQQDPVEHNKFHSSWTVSTLDPSSANQPLSPDKATSVLQSISGLSSYCAPASVSRWTTCCSHELELSLLRRTVEELQEGLSNHLARGMTEISAMRTAKRDQIFQALELFGVELNKTLCGSRSRSRPSTPSNCTQLFADISPKFRLMVEQFMVGQSDVTLDISIPIDNLVMQLLIDASCQPDPSTSGTTLEAFNEEIRCHKYCQARLNLILDSMMSNAEHPLLAEPMNRYDFRMRRRRRRKVDLGKLDSKPGDLDQYKLLYSPELLITIRLNRLLMQSLEVAVVLMEGLKEFNAAQGTCAYKLMRMHHCALCAGKTLTRPCPELCLSTLSNCLKPLSQLDAPWNRFIDAIKLVAQTFLQKPQLGLMVQFKQLPKRLIGYFRHLLKTHKHWLQPQCSGTTKLLDLFEMGGPISYEEEAPSSSEMNILRSHQAIMKEMVTKMEQLSNIWSSASSAICTESPHLVPTSKMPDQCWNGTAQARFTPSACEFCDTSESVDPSWRRSPDHPRVVDSWGASNDADNHGRKQRTSSLVENQQQFAANPFGYPGPVRFPQAIHESATEHELSTHRANEILVRASRDLQWSTESLLNEIQTYYTIKHRLFQTNSEQPSSAITGNANNGQTETWIQLPKTEWDKNSATQYAPSKLSGTSADADDMSNSLGMLAYGSMLGWNSYGAQHQMSPGIPSVKQNTGRGLTVETMTRGQYNSPNASSTPRKPIINVYANSNNSGPLEGPVDEGSGLSIGWPLYNWPKLPPTGNESSKPLPVEPNTGTVSIPQESNFEGSGGFPGVQSGLQVDYADYPHLNTFHNFLNPNQLSQDNSPTNINSQGGLSDDEDSIDPNEQPSGSERGVTWMSKLNATSSGQDSYSDKISPTIADNSKKESKSKSDKGLGNRFRWTDRCCAIHLISITVILIGRV